MCGTRCLVTQDFWEESPDDSVTQSDVEDHNQHINRSKLVNDAQEIAQPSQGLNVPEPPSDVLMDPSLSSYGNSHPPLDSSIPSVVSRREKTESDISNNHCK